MAPSQNGWSRALLRATVVACSGILAGYALYPSLVFVPTMKPSQFVESSITAGIAIAAFRTSSRRNALAALFIWFVIVPVLAGPFHYWLLVLAFVYVSGIAGAIYCYDIIVHRGFADAPLKRTVLAGGLVALANGLIIIVLSLILFRFSLSHLDAVWTNIVDNLKLGALIGLAVGVGIELAEYAIRRMAEPESHNEAELSGTGSPVKSR